MHTKTNRLMALMLLAASFLFSFISVSTVSAATATITTNDNIILNASSAGDGTTIDAESIGITTTCNQGYNLTISTSTSSNLYLNGDTTNPTSFTAVDGTSALNSNNNTNKWGYTLTNNATSSTIFSPLSTTASSLRTISQTTNITTETIPIYYGIKADSTINPGTYSMGNNGVITYYLTMNPLCNVVDIAYDGNNADAGTMGAVGTGVIHTGVKDGDTVDLVASNFSRTGYGFAGWSIDPDAGTKLLDNDNTNNPIVYGPQESVILPEGFTANDTDNDGIVKLYAVWLQSQGDLQGWIGCSDLDTATYDSSTGALDLTKKNVTALTDQRDNDTYAVARLADGKCWMIENLRLDNDAAHNSDGSLAQGYGGKFGGLADAESTGFTWTYTANSLYYSGTQEGTASIDIYTTNSPAYRMPRYNSTNTSTRASNPTSNTFPNDTTGGMYSYGNYYTWHAAIADLTYNGTDNQSTTGTSLCPTGWHLPKGGNNQNTANNEFLVFSEALIGAKPANYDSKTYPNYIGTPEGTDASNKLRAYPNNFLYSGTFLSSTAHSRGINGFYWSSTANDSTRSYELTLGSLGITPGANNGTKYSGDSIRCVASDPITYVLTYDANGGTGAPSSQSTTANGSTTFTLSNTTPTRSGHTFVGWTDEKGNEFQPGATLTTKEVSTTLYAIWTNNSCNPTATTIGTGNTSTDAVCLQDVKPSMKASLPIATTTTGTYNLIDARDGQSYTIAKLSDGELWMTKNLNYSSTVMNTPYDTDVSSSTFRLPQSTTTSNTDNNAATIRTTNNSGNNDNGTYYSWPAAIASTESYTTGNITSSICPKGWDLPTNNQYTNLSTQSNYSSTNQTTLAPSSFLINGGFTNGATFYQTSYSHFWTSTVSSSTAAYGARVNGTTMTTSASVSTTYGGNKYYRKNIRCIASNGTATVHYNANGGSGTMPDQTGDIITMTISANSFTPPNEHQQFREWCTNANGTGTCVKPGASTSGIGLTDGATVNLYAQWDDIYYISFDANESSVGSTPGSATGTMTNQTIIRDIATKIKVNAFALTGYIFIGWNTNADGTGTFYSDEQKITNLTSAGNTITLYAVWRDGAYLDTGQNVNQKLKRLAGNSSATYSTTDTSITALVRSNTLPNGFTPSSENTISDNSSPLPIYAWYDSASTTIYYYSEATNIIMNKYSSYFFSNMRAVSNLTSILTWDTSKVITMSYMFSYTSYNASTFSLDFSSWDTSSVSNMSYMFSNAGYNASTFSLNLASWNTSNVTDLHYMFYYAGYSATTWSIGSLSSWDTSSVSNMSFMFRHAGFSAPSFILDLSSWNTSNVTDMREMFNYSAWNASTFSLNLSTWDTSNVRDMYEMFSYTGYNATTWSISGLSAWNTSSVTNMTYIFTNAGHGATTFSLDLSSWDTSGATDMHSMFAQAGYSATTWSISGLSSWNTSNVTDMYSMFDHAGYNATTFSLDLSSWNTSNVTDMYSMFDHAGYSATTFTLNLSTWNTSNVTDMHCIFNDAGYSATTWSISGLSSWNTSNVTNMSLMFSYAGYKVTTFALDLSSWNTSSVTDMHYMFYCAGFNATTWSVGNLSTWNTSNVTDMQDMFAHAGFSASSFVLGLSSWDTSSVTNMTEMFLYAGHSATTWSITIPKTNNGTSTGPISNTTSNIYGNTTSVTGVPPSGRSFTLAN